MTSMSRLHVVCNETDVPFPSTVDSPWTLRNTRYKRPSGSALRLGYVLKSGASIAVNVDHHWIDQTLGL